MSQNNKSNNLKSPTSTSGNESFNNKTASLEIESRKWKRLALLLTALGVLIGSGGVIGIIQWISGEPLKNTKEIFELEVGRHEARIDSIWRSIDILRSMGESEHTNELLKEIKFREIEFRKFLDTIQHRLEDLRSNYNFKEDWLKQMESTIEELKVRTMKSMQILNIVLEDHKIG